MPNDNIVFKFPLSGYSLGASLFQTLAKHGKITIRTKDVAFSMLSQMAQLIVQQMPPDRTAGAATLEVLHSSRKLTVTLQLSQPLSAPVIQQLQQLDPTVAVKSAKKKSASACRLACSRDGRQNLRLRVLLATYP